jgi:hypothetical protein
MRSLLSILTAGLLCVAMLAGCGGSQTKPADSKAKPPDKTSTGTPTAPEKAPVPKPTETAPGTPAPTPTPVAPAETPKPAPPTEKPVEKPAEAPKPAGDALVWWKLDDAKGTTAADASGKKNDGTVTGDAAWGEGKVGGALTFPEGKDSYVSLGTVKDLAAGNTAHTIAAWVKVTKLPENRAWMLLLGSEGEGSHHWLINNAGETQFGVWGGNQAKPALEVGKWKHVAITFDGKTLTGYLDGQKTESTEATFNLQGVGLTIAQVHNGENSFEGAYDDVRVYGRALSDKEVADLAKAPAGK